ncbi:histidinol-phosphate aminotransferase [Vibrio variabilis]|uniref:Histidinol-phosphate aminotransferase n=1 Tax=Vibrio variabilis TaxID=990271 RepID=A0ABQ0JFB0_9VIBR|nr:histidinol-phosphate aminotransferase [Vibrio variabilis]
MSEFIAELVPQAVKKLIPYQSARRIGGSGRVWLNANELEHPVQNDSADMELNRYPDFLPQDIAKAYQRYARTSADVVAVRGADEAIDLLIRTFCQPGKDSIVICSPTYAMYEFCAESLAIEVRDVPLKPCFNLDVDKVVEEAKHANMVFLCSPNNPTGNVIPRGDIISVLERTQQSSLVVVDEAYIEFELGASTADLIEQFPHLVVIRTLSKAFGLAAVRCGFIVASSAVMEFVNKLIPPYPMPDCSSKIVLKSLSGEGLEQVKHVTEELIATRDWFSLELAKLDIVSEVYPSSTNFVLVKARADVDLFDVMKNKGIVTRNQTHEPALQQCVRITIGSKASMLEVIDVLTTYSEEQCVELS